MSEPYSREDETILATLETLEADPAAGSPELAAEGAGPAGGAQASEADETLRRLYVETLGLLPYALEPVAPRQELKERVMAALAGEAHAARPAAAERPASRVVPIGAGRKPAPVPGAPTQPRHSWLSAAAAVVALAALALAGVLYLQLDRTRNALAELRLERGQLSTRLDAQEASLRQLRKMDELVSAVATKGVEVCPLRPVGDNPMVPDAFAVLYMPPGDEHWYLAASNLRPSGGGIYKVWLNTADGPMPVGVIGPGNEASLMFPAKIATDHHMVSIIITLESEAQAKAPMPEGPQVLYGDEKMQVL